MPAWTFTLVSLGALCEYSSPYLWIMKDKEGVEMAKLCIISTASQVSTILSSLLDILEIGLKTDQSLTIYKLFQNYLMCYKT